MPAAVRSWAQPTLVLWPLISEDEVREMFSRLYAEGEGSVPELKTYYEFTYEDYPENPLVQTRAITRVIICGLDIAVSFQPASFGGGGKTGPMGRKASPSCWKA